VITLWYFQTYLTKITKYNTKRNTQKYVLLYFTLETKQEIIKIF
jgi:hypothetical protein